MTESLSGFELGTDGPRLIVVGIDASRTALRAAAYAAGLARRQGSDLAVVHVLRPGAASGADVGAALAMTQSRHEIAAELQATVEQGARDRGVRATFYTVTGDPYTEITRLATELRADAVVVGASEAAGHRLVGSIAARLVKSGRWPVTVVP